MLYSSKVKDLINADNASQFKYSQNPVKQSLDADRVSVCSQWLSCFEFFIPLMV